MDPANFWNVDCYMPYINSIYKASGVVMGGRRGGRPERHLLRGRQIERIVKKLCCVREIKKTVFSKLILFLLQTSANVDQTIVY